MLLMNVKSCLVMKNRFKFFFYRLSSMNKKFVTKLRGNENTYQTLNLNNPSSQFEDSVPDSLYGVLAQNGKESPSMVKNIN